MMIICIKELVNVGKFRVKITVIQPTLDDARISRAMTNRFYLSYQQKGLERTLKDVETS